MSRVLVAGIGNVFLADDAFGPEVVAALREDPLPPGVELWDAGIRGMELAYRLLDGYGAVVLVDAAPRGGAPGTLYLIEPDEASRPAVPEAHGMDPVTVLALARDLAVDGAERLPRVVVLACEPELCPPQDDPDLVVGLSEAVRQAVPAAADLVRHVVARLLREPDAELTAGTA
ncbi:hydrogenase maturation protease [Kitasatospora sp. NPDC017646]|uniref:hydrogenase maturation protease n=1 Tax=Kitasatospora sp. NPDC017646 TaxID=3364024 RepID=UPI0037B40001